MFHTFTALSSSDFMTQLIEKTGWVVVSENPLILEIPAGGYIELDLNDDLLTFNASQQLDQGWLDSFILPCVPLYNGSFDVWLSVNTRRITGVLGINGRYHPFYFGLIRPMIHRGGYSFPCFLGGSNATAWDDESAISFLFHESDESQAGNSIFTKDNEWAEVGHYSGSTIFWPCNPYTSKNINEILGDFHSIYPIHIRTATDDPTHNQYVIGNLDGIFQCSAAPSETIIKDKYVVFQDLELNLYYALEMR